MQREVDAGYRATIAELRAAGERIETIDGELTEDAVFAQILALVGCMIVARRPAQRQLHGDARALAFVALVARRVRPEGRSERPGTGVRRGPRRRSERPRCAEHRARCRQVAATRTRPPARACAPARSRARTCSRCSTADPARSCASSRSRRTWTAIASSAGSSCSSLDRNGPLVDVDVVPGDVLLAINGKPLSRPDQLQTCGTRCAPRTRSRGALARRREARADVRDRAEASGARRTRRARARDRCRTRRRRRARRAGAARRRRRRSTR